MKYHRIILFSALVLIIQPAAAKSDSLISGELMDYIGYGAVITMLFLFLVVMLVLLRTFKVLTRIILKNEGYTDEQIIAEMKPAKKEKKPRAEVWQKLLSLRPLEEENEILITHDYDGIQELDNPIPAWFMYLFYGSIVFGIGYLLNYHVFKTAPLQYAEYKTEMAQADLAKKAFLSKAANRVDETCAACHGDHAQGNVGPNLTDDYWLHGGKIGDLFKTIKYGVLSKGMPTWEKQLTPKQISDVANYIKSLHGTKPAGAKEPQGTKEPDNDDKLTATIKK
jgi:cytochrome c oxidase cbb3-type subunit 3